MTTSTSIEKEKSDLTTLNLEPAHLDFLSVRAQIVIAAILSSILVFVIYAPTLKIGFLHDDFLHLDYVARAVLKGDAHDFLANLYSNWGGSDLMRSYRPLVSISLLLDFIVFRANAFGFHLTNLILTCACSLFVALIASELSGAFGNRMKASTAIWAALLFAAYPLHAESVSWVIGRVDLLCTLFYLASLYYFLRLRLIEEPPFLWLTTGCFFLALLSKEMAVTLPAVVTVFAFLIPTQKELSSIATDRGLLAQVFRKPNKLEQQALGLLWMTLVIFAVIRFVILGNPIGGYGNSGLTELVGVFANQAALTKIIAPTNEEVLPANTTLLSLALIPYVAAVVFATLRCLITPSLIRYFVAFGLFAAIALLPTYQVWNIAPNLCGSRLFFLSSAALTLALAFAFIPGEDGIDRKSAKIIAPVGLVFLVFTLIFFAFLGRGNVSPYVEAGKRLQTLRQQARTYAPDESSKILLLNLPSDFRGAPMLARTQYFKTMMSAPFSESNFSERVNTVEMELPCDHVHYSASKLTDALSTAHGKTPYFWSDAEGKILPLLNRSGKSGFKTVFDELDKSIVAPNNVKELDGSQWHVFNIHAPKIEKLKNRVLLYPGNHGLIVKHPIEHVNPISTALIKIKMSVAANQNVEQLLHLIQFNWDQKQSVVSKNKTAILTEIGEDNFECPMINNKEWLMGGSVEQVGLSLLPANYCVTIESIEGISTEECVPELLEGAQKGKFKINASKVRDAASVLVLVSNPDTTFDTVVSGTVLRNYRNLCVYPDAKRLGSPDSSITGKVLRWLYFDQTETVFNLPQEVYNDGRSHQVVAVSLDKNGAVVGLPSRVLKVK